MTENEKEPLDTLEAPESVDFDAEVKEMLGNVEPSEEVKECIEQLETQKEQFNEKIEKEPERAEEIVSDELKAIERLKKRVEAMKAGAKKTRLGNEGFTNWWNGSSDLF